MLLEFRVAVPKRTRFPCVAEFADNVCHVVFTSLEWLLLIPQDSAQSLFATETKPPQFTQTSTRTGVA
jgi:hypothetical protein